MIVRGVLVALGSWALFLSACSKVEDGFSCKNQSQKSDHLAFTAVASAVEASDRESAEPECGVRNPVGCRSTNELVWAPDFRRAVESFGGKARTSVLGAGEARLSDVLISALGGPPDDPTRLPNGSRLFTACVAHSCTEKGAIVLTSSGSITVAATLTNHLVNEGDVSKPSGPHYSRLDIFLADPAPADSAWCEPMRIWAKAAYATNRKHFSNIFKTHSIGLTEYHWLVSPESGNLTQLHRFKIE